MPHLQSPEQLKEANMGFGYSKGAPEGTRAICISPLGYYEDGGLRLMDRITKKTISQKRKDIVDLLENPADFSCLSENILMHLILAEKHHRLQTLKCGNSHLRILITRLRWQCLGVIGTSNGNIRMLILGFALVIFGLG